MSEVTHSSHGENHYLAAGVFKIDSLTAGFPELSKIASEWAKDEGFYSLMVRKVSEENFGIQFVYYKILEDEADRPVKQYKKELQEKFGEGFYAWDYNESTSENNDRNKKMLFKQRELILE